jgi:hypothetical protein
MLLNVQFTAHEGGGLETGQNGGGRGVIGMSAGKGGLPGDVENIVADLDIRNTVTTSSCHLDLQECHSSSDPVAQFRTPPGTADRCCTNTVLS